MIGQGVEQDAHIVDVFVFQSFSLEDRFDGRLDALLEEESEYLIFYDFRIRVQEFLGSVVVVARIDPEYVPGRFTFLT